MFLQQKANGSVGVKSKAVELDSDQLCFLHLGRNFALDPVVLVGDAEMLSRFSGSVWNRGHGPEKGWE